MNPKHQKLVCLAVFAATLIATLGLPRRLASAESKSPFKKLIETRERVAAHAGKTYRLPAASAIKTGSLLVSLPSPAALGADDTLLVTLREGQKVIARKPLHAGDPDLYTLFRLSGEGQVEVTSFAASPIDLTITALEWPETAASNSAIETEPNDAWREANEFTLGQTVWATASRE
jgi:hypothetical protein